MPFSYQMHFGVCEMQILTVSFVKWIKYTWKSHETKQYHIKIIRENVL